MWDNARRSEIDDRLARYTKQLAVYTGFLSIATIVGVGVTLWVALSTKDLRDFAEKQAQDTAELIRLTKESVTAATSQSVSAKVQADAAVEANKHTAAASQAASELAQSSLRAAMTRERAYLIPEDASLSASLPKLFIRNIGLSPSYQVRVSRRIVLFDTKAFDPSNYHPDANDEKCGNIASEFVGAGNRSPWTISFSDPSLKREDDDATPAEMQDFAKGKKIFVLSGKVCYRDIYHHLHYTSFCWYYEKGDLLRKYFCQQDDFN